MKILVLGSTGMLGATLSPYLMKHGYDVVNHGNTSVSDVSCDLTDLDATQVLFTQVVPDVVINLVACTNVDQCEENINNAYQLNVKVVENIANVMRDTSNCFLLHISTDQVYDKPGPSFENDINLTNIYALTKYASELAAQCIPSTILRTNFIGPSLLKGRNSFSDWILDSLHNNNPITVFSDIMVNPLSMATLSEMILKVIIKRKEGVYNLGSRNPKSKADIAFEIANKYQLSITNLSIGISTDMKLPAYRPKDMSMDCQKFEKAFDVKLPNLIDEIHNMERNLNVITE